MKIILILSLWISLLPIAFGQTPVQHEIGIDLGGGISGILSPQKTDFSARQTDWAIGWSLSNTLKYSALFLQQRLNVGIGLGYLRKSALVNVNGDPFSQPSDYQLEMLSEALILPVEVGYRWPLGGAHSLLADALFIPGYQLVSPSSNDIGNSTWNIPIRNRFNLDLGLKLGYRLQMTEQLSLQVAVLGTFQPFDNDAVLERIGTLQLNLGVRYQL